MNIQAAVIAAHGVLPISRREWKGNIAIYPTDTPTCAAIICREEAHLRASPRWEPSREDLIADDWELNESFYDGFEDGEANLQRMIDTCGPAQIIGVRGHGVDDPVSIERSNLSLFRHFFQCLLHRLGR